ncbi:hypothetical protein CPB84DRAFT_1711602 [Gymnopilus junonius]|uniref:Disease resistance R13L4/SHOC-2-like LRR domain-containing protein n=1 Tax=Gymnopilus junonius TaxID=109634 RepID=A0A9P5TL67_GYMJU|nr:hypothetical protein CPB84DRAFT_1711602 [Gymnopilus junonius]
MSNQDYEEKALPPFSRPLSLTHIAEARKRSPDGGATIVLSKLGISDVGSLEAEELAQAGQLGGQETGSTMERLALGNNRLSTLPPEFAHFTRLRYLNLKHNSFTAFPEVLNLIPFLDTLDLSHNKIKHLPSNPGNLVRLRVLCLSRNKLTRLPPYITQFQSLEVLQIDRNPWEWPPMSVFENLNSAQHENNGGDWLLDLYAWMESDGQNAKYDDSGYSEHTEWGHDSLWQFPLRGGHVDAGPTPHARSFSIGSNTSTSSVAESLRALDISENNPHIKSNYTGRSTPAQTELSNEVVTDLSFTQSPMLYDEVFEVDQMHNRTQSHAGAFSTPQYPFVFGKKSLPDLRTVHKEPSRSIPTLQKEISQSSYVDAIQASTESSFHSSRYEPAVFVAKPAFFEELQATTTNSIAAEKISYFRRTSNITMNQTLPKPIFRLLESARSILFATGQLYQALENYHEADERLSPILKKLLEPANVSLLYLIRSLEHFHDVSQKAVPSPSVCRRVVESCKDTIAAFRKAVVLISSQISLYAAEDARCVRWLILELHGISVELSTSWKAMVPEIEYLKPFLYGAAFSGTSLPGSTESYFSTTFNLLAPDEIAPVARPRPADSVHSTLGPGRIRTARRHAGSFSSKDVEIGKDLPSYDILPGIAGGIASRTPMLRAPKRLMTLPMTTPSMSSQLPHPSNPLSMYSNVSAPTELGHHLRNISQSSFFDSSSLASATLMEFSTTAILSSEVIRAIQGAVDLTTIVCDQIEETLGDSESSNRNITEYLESARATARKLSEDVFSMLEGDSDKLDGRALREDARLFLKVTLLLSNSLRAQGNSLEISTTLKSNMLRLTNGIEEFSILLHVSSGALYPPASDSPTFSPKFAPHDTYFQRVEDNQLVSNFSRAKSAQSRQPKLVPAPLDTFRTVPVKPLNTRKMPVKDVPKSDPG